ncbi:PilZ domain-containing protein [Gallaecimonas xiamenensis]|uniref:Type IV pilus assembly PilZ n=1 Tax=Gallaecimonas xiamenensis 3-C-1 TaxID=745411 RepID=K2IQ31_9GAMM|nr:PilZ domain-containing protein [Gallaecimonas xiamenensis]EKE72246.1 type IV pilus assembly PilZ [Gallaecimonas xiamenensis 3-C-1]
MIEIDELRRLRRLEIDTPVTLVIEEDQLQGHCSDLSGKGMALILGRAVDPGTRVMVKLEGGMENLPPFVAEAMVVRCDPADKGFVVGVSFEI